MWTQEEGRKVCWRKLYSEGLHDMYSSLTIIPDGLMPSKTIKRWPGHVAHIGDKRDADWALVGIHARKTPAGRRKHRRQYNIKTDFKDTE
jgi:hypothetical protein